MDSRLNHLRNLANIVLIIYILYSTQFVWVMVSYEYDISTVFRTYPRAAREVECGGRQEMAVVEAEAADVERQQRARLLIAREAHEQQLARLPVDELELVGCEYRLRQ